MGMGMGMGLGMRMEMDVGCGLVGLWACGLNCGTTKPRRVSSIKVSNRQGFASLEAACVGGFFSGLAPVLSV